MAILKTLKNGAYFKRFQVQFKRRREGKTDYYARKRLIWQDKNKYNTPKYRMVVRFSNKDITCQIVYARVDGDKVFCSAYAHELPRYGLKVGLNNYSAAYATGLLLARRTLAKLGMDEMYEGTIEADGRAVEVEVDDERRQFTANLDIGLRRTTTGANIFGCMKGAVDGGLNVPHSEKRFPGYNKATGDYNSDMHKDRIFGKHVSDYMSMIEDDEALYKRRFGQYIKNGIDAQSLEDVIKSTHEAIRADPSPLNAEKREYTGKLYTNKPKMNLKQKKDRIRQIKDTYLTALRAENDA